MMGMMEVIMIYLNYLICANSVFINIKDCFDDFETEAKIISEAKCLLACNSNLEDFYIDEGIVRVTSDGNYYYLDFNNLKLTIQVFDRMIIDYKVR